MKVLSRDFTTKEKALILVLVLILLGLVYYRFVDQNVRDAVASSESEAQMLQTQLDTAQQRVMYLQGLQNKMDALKAEGKLSYMGSYNNSKAEVAFLNDILAQTQQYSIEFANVTRSGNQIRRSFTLRYQTPDYAAAQAVMKKLCAGDNRCLVGDVRCTIADNGTVIMQQAATFYETMVDGTPDAGLPRDTAAVNG